MVTVLGAGLDDGLLTPAEFEDRAGAAYAARWHSDLDELTADLPAVATEHPVTSIDAWCAIARQAWLQLRADAERLFHDADGELRVDRCALGIVVAALVLIAALRGWPVHVRH